MSSCSSNIRASSTSLRKNFKKFWRREVLLLVVTMTARKSTTNKTACLMGNRTKSKKSMRRLTRSLKLKAVNNRSKTMVFPQNRRS